jgi:hypothetical protein
MRTDGHGCVQKCAWGPSPCAEQDAAWPGGPAQWPAGQRGPAAGAEGPGAACCSRELRGRTHRRIAGEPSGPGPGRALRQPAAAAHTAGSEPGQRGQQEYSSYGSSGSHGGWTAGGVEVVEALLAAGAAINTGTLHWAASQGHTRGDWVLLAAGADADKANTEGRTALDAASQDNKAGWCKCCWRLALPSTRQVQSAGRRSFLQHGEVNRRRCRRCWQPALTLRR